jgi:PAS domain S-box-containing protein
MSNIAYSGDLDKTREQLIEELRASETRFRLLFDDAPLGYQSLDENGYLIEVNQAWLDTLGYVREEVIGKSFSDFLHPDWKDHFRVNFPRFKAVGEVLGVEFEMVKKDGAYILVSFNGKIGKDEKGRFRQTHCILHDITDSKHIEQQLSNQREILKGIFDNIPILLVMWDPELQRFTLNRHAESVLAWTTADANDGDFMSKVYPDAEYRAKVSEYMQSLKSGWHEWVNTTKVGNQVPIDWANIRLSDDMMIGIGVDLRERKRTEEQLRSNNETFYNLIQNNPFGVYVIDSQFRLLQVSSGAQKVFSNVNPHLGRDFSEILRLIWEEPFASEAIGRFRHTLESGESYISPSTVEQRRDIKEVEAYDWRIERITLPDGSYGVVCYFYDLSERQRFEAALRQSEHLYRTLASNLPNGAAFVVDKDLRYILAEGQALQQAGMQSSDLEGKTIWEALEPDLAKEYEAPYRTALSGNSVYYEHNAHGHNYITHVTPLKKNNDDIYASLAVSYEITDRKRAEEALRASEQKLSAVLDQLTVGVALINNDGQPILSNLVYKGYVPGSVLSMDSESKPRWQAYDTTGNPLPPNQWPAARALRGEFVNPGLECQYTDDIGQVKWAQVSAVPFHASGDETTQAIIVIADITERKQAEDELHQNKERLRSLNENLERLVDQRTAIAEKRARQLQQLASELSNAEDNERKRMAMILHDDLQQHLGAMRFNIFTLLSEDLITGETKERLLQFEALIDQAIKKTRSLSHELSPPVLHQSGFLAALNWLVKDALEKHGQKVTLNAEPGAEPNSAAVSSILYRSVRELLFNAIKHSGTKAAQVIFVRPSRRRVALLGQHVW